MMKSILRIINNNHHHFFSFYKGVIGGKYFFFLPPPEIRQTWRIQGGGEALDSPLVNTLEDVRHFVRLNVRVRNRERIFDGFECLGDGRRL